MSAPAPREVHVRRWLLIWLVLLGLSAILARYFDHGAPPDWPDAARFAIATFLAPGGLAWMGLFWHAFGPGPTGAGLVCIALLNSTVWLVAAYTVAKVVNLLRRRVATRSAR
jgi:hypothetical protein